MLAGSEVDVDLLRGMADIRQTIVAIGSHDVKDLQGMTDALNAFKPGDATSIVVLRGTERVTLQVTLGTRANR